MSQPLFSLLNPSQFLPCSLGQTCPEIPADGHDREQERSDMGRMPRDPIFRRQSRWQSRHTQLSANEIGARIRILSLPPPKSIAIALHAVVDLYDVDAAVRPTLSAARKVRNAILILITHHMHAYGAARVYYFVSGMGLTSPTRGLV